MRNLDKELFAKNLVFLRERNGLTQTQVANILDTSQVNISNWEKGLKAPKDFSTLKKISDYFEVSVDSLLFENLIYDFYDIDPDLDTIIEINEVTNKWLSNQAVSKNNNTDYSSTTSKNNPTHPAPHILPLIVYGKVCAGAGFEAVENRIDEIGDPYYRIKKDKFALLVDGDSMNNVVNDGMYAIIEKRPVVSNGEIAVVLIDNEVGMLKRFYRLDDMVILRPDSSNPEHKPLTFVGDEINSLKLLGRYLGCVSPMENLI